MKTVILSLALALMFGSSAFAKTAAASLPESEQPLAIAEKMAGVDDEASAEKTEKADSKAAKAEASATKADAAAAAKASDKVDAALEKTDAATAAAKTEATTTAAKDIPANAKESEIPLNLEQTKKSGADSNGPFRILFSLSILGLLATGAFYFIKKYAKPQSQMSAATQIKVLTQHHLGPKRSLAIIRVAGESILIGVTDQNISMIKSLSLIDEEVPEEVPAQFGLSFGKVFNRENRDFVPSAPDIVFETGSAEQVAEKTPAAKISFANRGSKNSAKNNSNENANAQNEEEFSFGGIRDVVSKKLKGMRNLDI